MLLKFDLKSLIINGMFLISASIEFLIDNASYYYSCTGTKFFNSTYFMESLVNLTKDSSRDESLIFNSVSNSAYILVFLLPVKYEYISLNFLFIVSFYKCVLLILLSNILSLFFISPSSF